MVGGPFSSSWFFFEGTGNTREAAVKNARERCQTTDDGLTGNLVCDEDEGASEVYFNATEDNGNITCIGIHGGSDDFYIAYAPLGTDDSAAIEAASDVARTRCQAEETDSSSCADVFVTSLEGEFTTSGHMPFRIEGACDDTETAGLICEDDELPNIADGSCDECPTNTHVVVGGICEPIAECDADRQILNQTENECETCDFDKTPQNGECVCTDENTLDVDGTCTRILECIGNQIRDPEMPTECMNCGDKTANEERNLCEAACTGDNEVKDGEGDCRTCESDSIPNEANTDCLPNCSNHDEYKDTDGFCVQCNTGLVASDNNDSCVAVPAVKTPSSKTGVVLGLVVLGVYAANVFAAPAAESAAINWTPSYAFRNNNGNISYSVGSRWTARTDNWRYYWQTTQSGGKFSYGSGMNYKTGIFAATMDSESDSDITDLDISLSATKALGLWHFNGGYNLDARLSPTERTELQNRLNIAARYSLDKWILSATANTDGERAAARINYSYRF